MVWTRNDYAAGEIGGNGEDGEGRREERGERREDGK